MRNYSFDHATMGGSPSSGGKKGRWMCQGKFIRVILRI